MLLWLFIGVIVLLFIFSSIMYIRGSNKMNQVKNSLSSRREYVKTHRDLFGVANNGVSLDNRDIYCLTLDELGIKEVKP